MMNNHFVTLVRHAKSSWNSEAESDFDRPLNDRGKRDAPVMADRLVRRQCIPDLLLCSSANRAQETASYLMTAFNLPSRCLQLERDLYLASPETILQILSSTSEEIRHVMVVAHNPGLETLSELMAGRSLPALPTFGIRHFSCPSIRQLSEHIFAAESNPGQPLDGAIGETRRQGGTPELLFDDYPKSGLMR